MRLTRERYDVVTRERDRANMGLYLAMMEDPDGSASLHYERWRYVCRLYRAAGPMGGYVIVTARPTDGANGGSVECLPLDELHARVRTMTGDLGFAWAPAVDKLIAARRAIVETKP